MKACPRGFRYFGMAGVRWPAATASRTRVWAKSHRVVDPAAMWALRARTRSAVMPWRCQAAPSVWALSNMGVEAVAGGGETGLRGGAGLELIPQGAKLDCLIGGKEAEDAVGGEALAGMLIYHASGVVGEGVAGVDFDEVVDEEHFENAQDVEREGVGVFGEHDDHEAEVPGVLGVVFGAAAVEQVGLAEDFFEFIDLEDEGDLVAETVERRRGRDGHRVRGDVTGALPSFSLPVWGRDCSLMGPCP